MSASRTLLKKAADLLGYDTTHVTRTVAYRAVEARLRALRPETLDVMEISGGAHWRGMGFRNYLDFAYPEYDICRDRLDRQFDVILADNVFEHLKYPARAARNVHAMLKPNGLFVAITPFLIRYHAVPTDCTRWTPDGFRYFLEEAGFAPEATGGRSSPTSRAGRAPASSAASRTIPSIRSRSGPSPRSSLRN
jgi:SAM-dependent methyltransferase